MVYSETMGPLRRLASVEMMLRDMLYVSYLIPSSRLRPLIPASLEPAEVLPDRVFVSLVIFRGVTTRGFLIPCPRIPFDQVNIRTYVRDPRTSAPAVYFIHCGISGGLITFLYKTLSGMPVEHTPFSIDPGRSVDGRYTDYVAEGAWNGRFTIRATEGAATVESLPPFQTVQEAFDYLLDPLVGFYSTSRSLFRLEVFHEPLVPRTMTPKTVFFPYLTRLGLVPDEEMGHPQNLLLVPSTPFLIYLPPHKFAGRS
jgi:uncharacterized protein YqjF (DUF2071 family)